MDYNNIFPGMSREELNEHLEQGSKVFQNKAIKQAFFSIDRADFVQDDYKVEAYEDYPLPTTDGQTISQPTTVAFILELLDAQVGNKILDIGSGTGWTSALLGSMVGKKGMVYGLEIRKVLVDQSRKSLKKYNLPVEIIHANEHVGYSKKAPFDRILSGAAFEDREEEPFILLNQLNVGGIMVVPIKESIVKFEKISEDEVVETEFPGFLFVPYKS